MFIKHILCTVKPENKIAFSKAQDMWQKTKEVKGFIGQLGGWNMNSLNEAVILSFWQDKSSLDSFMALLHDDIFHKNKQQNTYETIEVSHFNCEEPIHKQTFLGHIKLAENLEVVKTMLPLNISFKDNAVYIESEKLENKKIKLINSWKIV